MITFRQRQVGASSTLGERLRQVRDEQHRALDDASRSTGVAVKYLKAIEDGRYADLPGPVYAKHFVRQYASYLNVRAETVLELFEREYAIAQKIKPTPYLHPFPAPRLRAMITPRGIRWLVILLLAVVLLVYLGLEVRRFTTPPTLTITTPPIQMTTAEHAVPLQGTTEPETTVMINGKIAMVDQSGQFGETLDLRDGINIIVIRAEKKRGGSTTLTRTILVQSN
jgi:cytoskeletal protein RodZ